MKMSLIVFVFVLVNSNLSFSQKYYSIPKIEITNRIITGALMDYNAEFKDDLDATNGAIIIRYSRQYPNKLFFAFKANRFDVINDPPSYYLLLQNRLILVYTGFESYLHYQDESFVNLFRDGKKQLTEKGNLYDPIVWEITLSEKSYEKKNIQSLPY